jgi:ubiquitin carboxyl-terminal hydrolase 7
VTKPSKPHFANTVIIESNNNDDNKILKKAMVSNYSSSVTLVSAKSVKAISLLLLATGYVTLHAAPKGVGATSLPLQNKVLLSGGLLNLGNTCYLNSQLECQYHIPLVRDLIITPVLNEECNKTSESEEDDDDSSVKSKDNSLRKPSYGLLALQHLFSSMKVASLQGEGDPSLTASISTATLCRALGINPYEQQDSGEFWKLLLPEIQYPQLERLYRGHYESYIVALDGSGRERKRKETFLDLSLDITNFDSVYDSFNDMFTGGEVLSVKEGNGWRPEKGEDKVDALKGSSIARDGLPSILQLHLMRFKYDWQTETMSKINHRYIFPLDLNLGKICKDGKGDENLEIKDESVIYDLQSIVVHSGEFGHGHYYAYIRPNIRKNKWFRFDDDRVTEVSFKEVKDDAYGGHVLERRNNSSKSPRGFLGRVFSNRLARQNFGWGGKKSSAYMLQYVKRSDIPFLFGTDEK